MPVVTMNIDLLNEEYSYSPGEAVKGFININVSEQVIISSVKAALHGTGVLKSSSRNNANTQDDASIEKKESYVSDEKILFTSQERNIQNLYTEVGNHVYPFSFKLPKNIPSSFESDEGYTRYSIHSLLEGFNTSNCDAKVLISVNSPLDLNEIPKSQYPALTVNDKRNGKCFCLTSTGLRAVVHTSRRGYVPGEVIVFNAEIDNDDSKPVASVKAQLVQVIKLHHKSWPKKVKRVVTEVTRGCILPKKSQYWIDETLLIPSVVASYLKHCHLIDLKYQIHFRISKADKPEEILKLPIIIGTIPLMGNIDVLSEDGEPSVVTLDKVPDQVLREWGERTEDRRTLETDIIRILWSKTVENGVQQFGGGGKLDLDVPRIT